MAKVDKALKAMEKQEARLHQMNMEEAINLMANAPAAQAAQETQNVVDQYIMHTAQKALEAQKSYANLQQNLDSLQQMEVQKAQTIANITKGTMVETGVTFAKWLAQSDAVYGHFDSALKVFAATLLSVANETFGVIKNIELTPDFDIAKVGAAINERIALWQTVEQNGLLDSMVAVAEKLAEMGCEEIEPANSIEIISATAATAKANNEDVIHLLPLFAEQVEKLQAQPGCENITIYDVMRSYADDNAPDGSPQKQAAEAARKKLTGTAERDTQAVEDTQEVQVAPNTQLECDVDTNKPAEPSPIQQAREGGALTTIEGHVAIIADAMLQNCFTSSSIKALPGALDKYQFDDDGKLTSLNGEPLQELDEMHTGFQMALLQIAALSDLREYNSKTNSTIGIYLPAFFRETGIDPRPRQWDKATGKVIARQKPTDPEELKKLRFQRFVEFMQPLDNRVGVIKGEGVYRDATFQSYDEKAEIVYITTPYSFKLAELARLHSDRYSAISHFFRANILTENQTAVELANRITIGLIERGVTLPDSGTYRTPKRKPIKRSITTTAVDGKRTTVTETFAPVEEQAIQEKPKRQFSYWVRFDSLIADCPQLQRELSTIRNSDIKNKSQFINKKLKDIFTAAVKIIMEKSEVPHYYKDLTITTDKFDTFKAPTNSTLTGHLIITHKGKNPDFAS